MALIDFPTLNAAKKYIDNCLAGAGALKGNGISKVEIDTNGHLIITYEKPLPDGTATQDAGVLPISGSFIQDVQTLSKTWTIQHNLNTNWNELIIITTDSDDNYIIGDIDVVNSTDNLLILKFSEAVAGKAVVKK